MSNPKYKIGERIKVKNIHNERSQIDWDYSEGHVVLIMNSMSDDREYYCSMYPGAMSEYYWIECVDLAMNVFDDDKVVTTQALNKFREEELEYSDEQKIRKKKLEQIENNK